MLHDVYLYGKLGEKYGKKHRFDITTAPEAVRALRANFNTFAQDFADGFYRIVLGDIDTGTELEPDLFSLTVGHNKPVHIIPVAAGSKGGGGLKVIAGVALLVAVGFATGGFGLLGASAIGPAMAGFDAAGYATLGSAAFTVGGMSVSYGSLALLGATMLFSGISQLIATPPKSPVTQATSFLFNGAVNRDAQGCSIPIIYGEFRCGSIVGSAGMTTEQLI